MRRGFTLIELLAVIVIIAIIALIGTFSVTKIIQKVRTDALNDTALSAKRAVKQYVTGEGQSIGTKEFNLTPGGEYANLFDLSKDPWGNDYEYVKAVTYIDNDKMIVDLYLKSPAGCFYLANSSDKLTTDATCGLIKPTNLGYVLNSDNSYTFSWVNGNGPFELYLDNSLVTSTSNHNYQYYPPIGTHQFYVKAQSGQVSDTLPVNIYEELGGSNVIASTATSKGWYLEKAGGTVANIDIVYDNLLNKNVIEAVMTTSASWGSVLKYNIYSGEPKPVFNPGVTYHVEFKSRLTTGLAGRYFGIKETSGTDLLWEAPYYNINSTWQTFSFNFVAGTEGPSPVFYHYMATNSPIRIADLKITNVIP